MPPTRKAADTVRLRDAIADVMRDGLDVAIRFEALGAAGSGDAIRSVLDQLDAGEPVTIASWELAEALDRIGAPLAIVRDVATGNAYYLTVHRDGTYEPAS
jgi:hypothetical protein